MRIEVSEHFVQMAGTVFGGEGTQTRAKVIRALREIGEAFEKSAQVEAGADGEDRKAMARVKVGEDDESAFAKATGRGGFSRIKNIEKMVRDLLPLRPGGLGSADVEASIELCGVAGKNFGGALFCEAQSQGGFAGGGGTDDGNKQRVRRGVSH